MELGPEERKAAALNARFPRLNKLHEKAVKIAKGSAEEDAGQKGKDKKKDDKKAKAAEEEVTKRGVEAIATDRKNLLLRLNLVWAWSAAALERMRLKADLASQQLNDWAQLQAKSEFQAAFEVQKLLGNHAEKEARVEHLWTVASADVRTHRGKLLWREPEPTPLEPRELARPDRCSIQQLQNFLCALEGQWTPVPRVEALLQAGLAARQESAGAFGLPQAWALGSDAVAEVCRGMDPRVSGYVLSRRLLHSLATLGCAKPTLEELAQAVAKAKGSDAEKFSKTPMWFDADAANQEEPGRLS